MKIDTFGRFLAVVGVVTAVAAVSVSIYLNPPSAVKAHSLDRERLQNLQQINAAIRSYYHNHKVLPDRLDAAEIQNSLTAQPNWVDPVTHHPYEYDVLSKTTYQLCANFSADSDKDDSSYGFAYRKHHKGHDCFQEAANTE